MHLDVHFHLIKQLKHIPPPLPTLPFCEKKNLSAHLSFFYQIGCHDDFAYIFLPDHPPEIINRSSVRALVG